MQYEKIRIDDVKIYPGNAKKHPEEQIDKIMRSIQEFGYTAPILIDEDDILLAGHGRLSACKKLDMQDIEYKRIEGLSEEQKKAYRIADNKSGESSWSIDKLKVEFKDLEVKEFDLTLTGFKLDEISSITMEKEQNTEVNKIGSLMITCPSCGEKFSKKEQKKNK